ncbi:hypothetical protein Lalb_Chr08g0233681 [Lupinus albus]|uniref:Uncharacterized protein n=1 Tax=Lupinus albus TaxID=3870 RepID=A0A6A4Q344_LUPAL|nr:hypothetical protein Lalb_Chr08g0233681 [Lupinus albus]
MEDDNFIVPDTNEMENQNAVHDMRLVGTLWSNEESNAKDMVEDSSYTNVLTK